MVGSTIFLSCAGGGRASVTYVPLAVAQISNRGVNGGNGRIASGRKRISLSLPIRFLSYFFLHFPTPFWPALCLRKPHSGHRRNAAPVCFNDLHCMSTSLSPALSVCSSFRQPGEKLFSSVSPPDVLTFHRSQPPPHPPASSQFRLRTRCLTNKRSRLFRIANNRLQSPFPFPACGGARVYSRGIRLVGPSGRSSSREPSRQPSASSSETRIS